MLDLLQVIRRNPQQFISILVKDDRRLTASILEDLLQPMFSEEGSNKRTKEETIFMNLPFFLQDVEGKNSQSLSLV